MDLFNIVFWIVLVVLASLVFFVLFRDSQKKSKKQKKKKGVISGYDNDVFYLDHKIDKIDPGEVLRSIDCGGDKEIKKENEKKALNLLKALGSLKNSDKDIFQEEPKKPKKPVSKKTLSGQIKSPVELVEGKVSIKEKQDKERVEALLAKNKFLDLFGEVILSREFSWTNKKLALDQYSQYLKSGRKKTLKRIIFWRLSRQIDEFFVDCIIWLANDSEDQGRRKYLINLARGLCRLLEVEPPKNLEKFQEVC